jgi:hypothetical protein
MTTTCLPAPIPLHRSWLRRLAADLAARWHSRRDRAARDGVDGELASLDERTLRDIGVPVSMRYRDHVLSTSTLDRSRW